MVRGEGGGNEPNCSHVCPHDRFRNDHNLRRASLENTSRLSLIKILAPLLIRRWDEQLHESTIIEGLSQLRKTTLPIPLPQLFQASPQRRQLRWRRILEHEKAGAPPTVGQRRKRLTHRLAFAADNPGSNALHLCAIGKCRLGRRRPAPRSRRHCGKQQKMGIRREAIRRQPHATRAVARAHLLNEG